MGKTGLGACVVAWVMALALPGGALAQAMPLPTAALERSCWLQHTRDRTRPGRDATAVGFSSLRDGFRLRSPLRAEFALRGMGLAPAGKPLAGTGHHHLLIDAPLPAYTDDPLPFSDTHKHYNRGQTGTLLDLLPGEHTLRLLMADHRHKPLFVYSPEIRITVTGKRGANALAIDPARQAGSCAEWYQDEVSRPRAPGHWLGLSNLRDGEPVTSPFTLDFGVEGFGVCAACRPTDRSGRFVLQLLAGATTLQTLDLKNGATQTTLALPNGNYLLRLRFVDSADSDLLPPTEHRLPVTAQERM